MNSKQALNFLANLINENIKLSFQEWNNVQAALAVLNNLILNSEKKEDSPTKDA